MDLITSCIRPFLSRTGNMLVRQFGYLRAKTIMKDLADAMKKLEAKRNDIRMKIEVAVRDRKQCSTEQVGRWIQKISEAEGEVTAIQNDYEQSRCCLLGARIPNCWSSYRTGRRASELLVKVIDLEEEADFGDISMQQPPLLVQDINPSTSTEGGSMMVVSDLEMVQRYLEEEGGGYVIGIWGMAGVGKTTLLQTINNVYSILHHSAAAGTKLFDHVIFIVVSKNYRLEKLQKDIMKRLDLSSNDNVESQATTIFDFLKEKNFLLLLDDVWEAVDLREIGIPDPVCTSNNIDRRHRHNVVITTRFEEVCGQMYCLKRIKVECLEKAEAWNLFKKNVGEELLNSHPSIRTLAVEVAKECGGLPLALIIIGRAMSTKPTFEAWDYAITQLRESRPSNIPGMEDFMFPTLKFSYDSLQDNVTRGCFLCCCQWPEDHGIAKDDLILAWMGLDLIDGFDDINEAYNLGNSVIESLLAASLLEHVQDDDDEVKMHDVIRDFAQWIACDCGKKRNKWLVKACAELEEVSNDMAAKWGEAEHVSLMYNDIQELPQNLLAVHYPNLTVLFLQNNDLREIPVGFLPCMPNLTYLDLSVNYLLEEIPNEIGCLLELRYLNLSRTAISLLPDELGQLQKLKCLLLEETLVPVSIPSRMLSSLSKIEFVDLYPNTELCSEDDELTCLLRRLKAIGMKIKSFQNLQRLSHHHVGIIRLWMEDMRDLTSFHLHLLSSVTQRCIQQLTFHKCRSLGEVVMDIASLPKLEKLAFYKLENMREIVWRTVVPTKCFRRLRYLYISGCSVLRNITWVLHLPFLEHLDVRSCDAMEQLIGRQVEGDDSLEGPLALGEERQEQINSTITFPRLKHLDLEQLPRLSGICSDYAVVHFPSLEFVTLYNCPEMKKLPFCAQVNCKKLRSIQCSTTWWDSIEWEDEDIKSSMEYLAVLS